MKVHYDPKVEELARYFLSDLKPARGQRHEDRITRLSEQIQQCIEEFLKFDL
jgi:hypothetical protein